MSIPNGLEIYEDILDESQCKKLYDYINNQEWDDLGISRKVQHYGYLYPYLYVKGKKCRTLPKAPRPTPEVLECMAKALYDLKVLRDYPDQIIVNKYLAGESIGAHTDHEDCFGRDIASLSLGSEIKMTFKPVKEKAEGKPVKLPLKVGSLVVMKDEARYNWTHSIEKTDTRKITTPRISITFRHVNEKYKSKEEELSPNSSVWSFSVGEKGFIKDSVGYAAFMEPTKKLEKWTIKDPSILKYEFIDVTPLFLEGGSRYKHVFTALKSGETVAVDGYTKNKVKVIVH